MAVLANQELNDEWLIVSKDYKLAFYDGDLLNNTKNIDMNSLIAMEASPLAEAILSPEGKLYCLSKNGQMWILNLNLETEQNKNTLFAKQQISTVSTIFSIPEEMTVLKFIEKVGSLFLRLE